MVRRQIVRDQTKADRPDGRSTIDGGFVLVPVDGLMACWGACRSKPLGIGDFRAWLACRELAARRCVLGEGRSPSYDLGELAGLLELSRRRAGASVRRLEAAGLLEWSGSALAFPGPTVGLGPALDETIGRGRGTVAIPRRILRFLAGGARPALIAAALGILLRCLSRRRGGFDGRGRVKSSWLARAFGIDIRRVKAARRELIALGWIDPEPSSQRAENRWGRAFRIDLAWGRPAPVGRELPPLPPPDRRAIATPSVNQDPFQERNQHQEPAPGRPAGASLGESGRGKLPPPKLEDVRPEDLKDVGRTLDLHRQAIARGLVGPSEHDRLKFVALAEHARSLGKTNPPGLFAALLRRGAWAFITQGEEDRANARIKGFLRGPSPMSPSALLSPRRPPLSEDARMVREVGRALESRGFRGDPFPQVCRQDPGWTRERWDRALAELGSRELAQ